MFKLNSLRIFFCLFLIALTFNLSSFQKTPEFLKLKFGENEEVDKEQKGAIPYLSFLTLKVSYFQEMVKDVKNYESFKMWETEDDSFRVNLISFPIENSNKVDVVVFFRGTEAWRIKNVLADFNLNEAKLDQVCQGCTVQQGYLDAFKSVEEATFNFIKEEITQIEAKGKELNLLYFAGHSLGGAMAIIGAQTFLYRKDKEINSNEYLRNIKKISLITFGCPKMGNDNFVNHIQQDKRILDNVRVVYGIDEVPFFPPEKLNYSQTHIGDLVYFRQNDYKNYKIIIAFNRGNKKTGDVTPKKYLDDVNNEQRGILNVHDRVLDHLRYAGITKETLSNAIMEIRNME